MKLCLIWVLCFIEALQEVDNDLFGSANKLSALVEMMLTLHRSLGAGTVFREQTVGFVVNFRRNGGELVCVSTSVVSAEEEFTIRKYHTYVGLRAAAVAAVGSGEGGRGGCVCHVFHTDIKPLVPMNMFLYLGRFTVGVANRTRSHFESSVFV